MVEEIITALSRIRSLFVIARNSSFTYKGQRFVYVDDGGFLTGSFADYAVPTASMIPELEILHMESPLAGDAARRQGRSGRQCDEHTGLHRQCRRRRARGGRD